MAFASLDPGRRGSTSPLAEINMVPLIDVMLVLLVIFMVTAPLLTHAVKLELPHIAAAPNLPPPERIEFAIDEHGGRFWNGEPVTRAEAAARLRSAGTRDARAELQLRADHRAAYGAIAETLADAAAAGLSRVGFVGQPEHR